MTRTEVIARGMAHLEDWEIPALQRALPPAMRISLREHIENVERINDRFGSD